MKLSLLLLAMILAFQIPTRAVAETRELLVDRVAAVVNNEIITQSELDMIFKPVYDQVVKVYHGSNLQEELERIRLQLLNQLIEDRLVYQEAKKLGITVGDDEAEEELTDFKSQFPSEEAFRNELERSNFSLPEIQKKFRERLTISKLHQYIIRGAITVSPEEVKQYFDDHQDEFQKKEEAKVWCITIKKSEEASRKGIMDEAAKRKAGGLIAQLKQGKAFEDIAKEHSQDAHAKQGGLIGFVHRGDMVENIDQVIFSLPENSFSDVLESEYAYHIFKIGEKHEASQKTFEDMRDEIRDKLFRQRAHERFVLWMNELKKKSFISIR